MIFDRESRLKRMTEETTTEHMPGLLYPVLTLAVVSFALAPILVRYAEDAPPLAVAVWRTVTAALVLVPFAARSALSTWRGFSWRERGLIVAAGVFQGLHFMAWIASLYYTTVASASVLVTTSPLFLTVLGYLLIGERLAARTVAAIGGAVVGASLIGWGDATGGASEAPAPLFGNALALGASLLVSGYLLIGRVVRRKTDWLEYVFPLYTAAALTCVAVALAAGTPLFGHSTQAYLMSMGLALGPQIIGHGSFNYALRYLPAAIVATLALLEPVGASGLAYVLFGEVPGAWAVAGMTLTLTSVGVLAWRER